MKRALVTATVVLTMTAAQAFAQSTTTSKSGSGQSDTRATAARAPATGARQKAPSGKAQAADQKFIMEAAKGGMAEVELGKLAADKASSDQVKQFGQRMVTDHGKANDELKSIAGGKNITLPSDLDAKDKALRDRLSKLSGAQFDRAYMQAMVRDHRKDVNEFKRESTSGKDADVKAFASKTLPTLEEHLKLAQDANRAVGTTGTLEKGSKKSGASGTSGHDAGAGSSTGATGSQPRR